VTYINQKIENPIDQLSPPLKKKHNKEVAAGRFQATNEVEQMKKKEEAGNP